jgi:hypothetical protein
MADSERSAATVLERLMPTSQAAERRSATIAASADHVWAALAQVTIGELRLFRLLMGFWVLPGRLLGSPRARFDADEPLLDWAVRFGFTILGEEARRELVVGAIGQPWRLGGGRCCEAGCGHRGAGILRDGGWCTTPRLRLRLRVYVAERPRRGWADGMQGRGSGPARGR